MLATRFSTSFGWQLPHTDCEALLVRIYPQQGIGQPFNLGQETIDVGRESAKMLLADDSVSRQHASIIWNGKSHVVSDLGSTNGTFVNDQRIATMELSVGDRVRFGNQLFKYIGAGGIEKSFHEIIFKIMTMDGLTETHNKAFLLESLERELQLTSRTDLPFSLMLMDIDFFKKINDSHGHLAGDEVLRQFAVRVKQVMRRGDLVARYGGEEFAVLCPQTELADALRLAERICVNVRAEEVRFEAVTIPMTVSIGVVQCGGPFIEMLHTATCDCAMVATKLLAQADHYLYQAKHTGRNRVCWPDTNGNQQPST